MKKKIGEETGKRKQHEEDNKKKRMMKFCGRSHHISQLNIYTQNDMQEMQWNHIGSQSDPVSQCDMRSKTFPFPFLFFRHWLAKGVYLFLFFSFLFLCMCMYAHSFSMISFPISRYNFVGGVKSSLRMFSPSINRQMHTHIDTHIDSGRDSGGDTVTVWEMLKTAGRKSLGGGIPGAIAMISQVFSLMWLVRTPLSTLSTHPTTHHNHPKSS
jgi:hypothetical protein